MRNFSYLLILCLLTSGCASFTPGVAHARLQIATEPRLTSKDKQIYYAAISACRKAYLAPKCYEDVDHPDFAVKIRELDDVGKRSIRAAHAHLVAAKKEAEATEADRVRAEFKDRYGLDDADLDTMDRGLSICDRLKLPRKCVSLLQVDVLERTYGAQLEKRDIANFAMAQKLLANIQRIDAERAARADETLDRMLDKWRYSTTHCTGMGGAIYCTTSSH